MPNEIIAAARSIGKALRPSEDNLDTAIASVAELMATIAKARLSAGVAFEAGHEAQVHVAAALEALTTARGHTLECHRTLDLVRAARDIDPDAAGCTLVKAPSQRGGRQLRAVGG